MTTYALDLSGNSPANLVANETHAVNASRFRDNYYIVPRCNPFYVDNFVASYTLNNDTFDLVEGVHFDFVLPYMAATRSTGKPVYGAITLHNLDINGTVTLKAYQTVGGEHTVNRVAVLTYMADKLYNAATALYDNLLDKPTSFPPSPHYLDYENMYGQEKVVATLVEIRDAILSKSFDFISALKLLKGYNGTGNLGTDFLKKTGDTMTGRLYLAGAPVSNIEAVTKEYVDQLFAGVINKVLLSSAFISRMNDKVDLSGDTMTGLLTLSGQPTADMHATPKSYVEAVRQALLSELDKKATVTFVNDQITALRKEMHELYLANLLDDRN